MYPDQSQKEEQPVLEERIVWYVQRRDEETEQNHQGTVWEG